MYLNPQYYLVAAYRWCFHLPRDTTIGGFEMILPTLLTYSVIGFVVLFLGYAFYMKTKHKFADEI
jgi:ABC-type polysaccharide/polyol phosphate export permease